MAIFLRVAALLVGQPVEHNQTKLTSAPSFALTSLGLQNLKYIVVEQFFEIVQCSMLRSFRGDGSADQSQKFHCKSVVI